MISFLGSDPPKVFLLLHNLYIINFRECWTHKYFSTSDLGPIFAVSKLLSFYYLGFSSALHAYDQLVWLLLQELPVSYFCAIMLLLPQYHQL